MTSQQSRSVVGLDIGGANLKAADGLGAAVTVPFALWKRPHDLASALNSLLAELPPAGQLAVTMTGELADCWPDRAAGVSAILDAVEQVAAGRTVHVWQTAGEFVEPPVAREFVMLTAAANWHALATWAGRLVPEGHGLLLDIGSTTTDIVLLRDGCPEPVGLTDFERLQSGELVYSGSRRTPVCAVARQVTVEDLQIPLAAELFATTLDVCLLTGEVPENTADLETADGCPATREAALARLRRACCASEHELTDSQMEHLAQELAREQQNQWSQAISQVLAPRADWPDSAEPSVRQALVCGSGSQIAERLAREHPLLNRSPLLRLDRAAGPAVATAACAHAVAVLAHERCPR